MQYVIQLSSAPQGVLETSIDKLELTDENMAEEQALRDAFLARVEPVLTALLHEGPHRSGNVSNVQVLGGNTWGSLNHYLLVLTIDIGEPRLDLVAVAGPGGTATVVGGYAELTEWSASATV